jgi:hypothetical protein
VPIGRSIVDLPPSAHPLQGPVVERKGLASGASKFPRRPSADIPRPVSRPGLYAVRAARPQMREFRADCLSIVRQGPPPWDQGPRRWPAATVHPSPSCLRHHWRVGITSHQPDPCGRGHAPRRAEPDLCRWW